MRGALFMEAAIRLGVPGAIIVCSASSDTVRERIRTRHADASDADWATHQRLAERWEEPDLATRRLMFSVSTDGATEAAVAESLKIIAAL